MAWRLSHTPVQSILPHLSRSPPHPSPSQVAISKKEANYQVAGLFSEKKTTTTEFVTLCKEPSEPRAPVLTNFYLNDPWWRARKNDMAGRVFDITKEWPLGDIEKMLNSPGICSYRFVPKSPPRVSPQERLHSVWSVKTELLSWLVSCDSSIFIQTKRADRTKGVCWVCKRGRVNTPNVFFADPVYFSRVLVHWRTGLLHHYKRQPDSELQKSQLTCVSVLQWIFTSLGANEPRIDQLWRNVTISGRERSLCEFPIASVSIR